MKKSENALLLILKPTTLIAHANEVPYDPLHLVREAVLPLGDFLLVSLLVLVLVSSAPCTCLILVPTFILGSSTLRRRRRINLHPTPRIISLQR